MLSLRESPSPDAMRAPMAQHVAHREARLAADLVIGGNRVHEGLNLLGRREPSQNGELAHGETQVLATGEAPMHQGGHAGR